MSFFETHEKLLPVITRFDDRFDFYEFHELFDISQYVFRP